MDKAIKDKFDAIDAESKEQRKLQEESAVALGTLSAERDNLVAQYFRDEVLPKLVGPFKLLINVRFTSVNFALDMGYRAYQDKSVDDATMIEDFIGIWNSRFNHDSISIGGDNVNANFRMDDSDLTIQFGSIEDAIKFVREHKISVDCSDIEKSKEKAEESLKAVTKVAEMAEQIKSRK